MSVRIPSTETNTLILSDPAKSTGRRSRLYQLARRAEERRLNHYNPALLLAWKENVDVSYIADKAHGVAGNTTGYIMICEKSHLEDIANDIKAVHLPTFTTGFVLPSIKNCVLSASSSVVSRIVVPAIE